MSSSSGTAQRGPSISSGPGGHGDPDQARFTTIARLTQRAVRPILGLEPASYIAGAVTLWYLERRAADPTCLATTVEFRRAVRNRINEELRKAVRESDRCDESADVSQLAVESTSFAARPRSPEERLIDNETTWLVQDAVSQLPPRMQRVIRLQDFEEMRQREVALELGITLGTVRQTRHQALERLREMLESAFDDTGDTGDTYGRRAA